MTIVKQAMTVLVYCRERTIQSWTTTYISENIKSERKSILTFLHIEHLHFGPDQFQRRLQKLRVWTFSKIIWQSFRLWRHHRQINLSRIQRFLPWNSGMCQFVQIKTFGTIFARKVVFRTKGASNAICAYTTRFKLDYPVHYIYCYNKYHNRIEI